MRIFIGMLLLLTLAACGTQGRSPRTIVSTLPDGHWRGDVVWKQTPHSTEAEPGNSGQSSILLAACAGEARVWFLESDGRLATLPLPFSTVSAHGSHLIYVVVHAPVDDPHWVETQAWTVVEINPQTALVEWSRSVSNRHLEASDGERAFGQHGSGMLVRSSDKCDLAYVRVSPSPAQ